jgi:hypothetical protein
MTERKVTGRGLCTTCVHSRTVTSARGSTFLMCRRAESDAAFARYPRLPVVECPGFETVAATNEEGDP